MQLLLPSARSISSEREYHTGIHKEKMADSVFTKNEVFNFKFLN